MPSLHIEHRENFVTEVVAHFDEDFACSGSRERLAHLLQLLNLLRDAQAASSISACSARLSLS